MEMRISGVYKPLIFLRKESFFFRKVCFVIYVQTKEPHMGHLRRIEFFYASFKAQVFDPRTIPVTTFFEAC